MFRHAFALARNADSAQDLVQESFITARRKLADIRLVGDSMRPWLLVACRNHYAKRQRSTAVHAVGQMSETNGRIVALCRFDGRSYMEAAGILGLKPTR